VDALPTGTVTFLFTDLEESTRLWEQHPDAMGVALARHDEILRDAVESHRGQVVKTTGDGVHAVFTTAADGLAAAAAAQQHLGRENWGVTGPLRVRMGLHTCEAELRDGDYYGGAVNRAARLMASAHGGQIVMSAATGELAQEQDLEVVDLGEHRLRDLARPERVWQLCPPDTSHRFPPLRSLDVYPGNLPSQLSSFVGRDDALAQVADDLRHHAVVTLTGPGGVGKTRLAVQACAEVLPRLRDGAWFVDLAPVRSGELVAPTVATVLGVKERAGEALAITLRDALRERDAVVLLDNGEHLIDDVSGLLVELTSRPVASTFLVTTREPLGIDGERVRRVASLDVDAAIDLFVQRASDVRADVDWSRYHDDISAICEQLDGIPLAVELAAAKSRSLLPPDILQRLDERFRLLSGSRRAARERHQTLLAAVEWSYDLLTAEERTLFDRLAVFRGSFELAAVEAVCVGGAVSPDDVVDLLDRLVDKSMVLAFERSGRSTYRLLETMRQFAESRLAASGQSDAYRERHVEHFRAHAGEWGPKSRSADQRTIIARLLSDRPNLNAMLDRLYDDARWADAASVCEALGGFWSTMAPEDGRRWFLALEPCADGLHSAPRIRFFAFGSYVLVNCGFMPDAVRFAERAIAEADRAGVAHPPEPYYALTWHARADGRPADAVAHAAQGAALAVDELSSWIRLVIRMQGSSALLELDIGAAVAETAAITAEARRLGIPTFTAAACFGEGLARAIHGEPAAAERCFDEATKLAVGNSLHTEIGVLLNRGLLAVDDDHDTALSLLEPAIDRGERHAVMPDVLAEAYEAVAWIWLQRGEGERAAVLAAATAALWDALGARGRGYTAPRREQVRARLVDQLAPSRLEELRHTGASLSRDEMRRFVLGELDPLATRTEGGVDSTAL
jgi:predicted ATPase/class 3 adenylate cyclase